MLFFFCACSCVVHVLHVVNCLPVTKPRTKQEMIIIMNREHFDIYLMEYLSMPTSMWQKQVELELQMLDKSE